MARTRVARFNIMITANANQVRQTFNKLSEQSKRWATSFTANLTSMSFAFNQISAAVGPVIGKIAEVSSGLNELSRAARQAGVSAAFLRLLETAAGEMGIEVDMVRDILMDFAVRLGELRRGEGEVVELFAAIGLSADKMSTDIAQAFMQFGEGLRSIEDFATRAHIADALLGEGGARGLDLLTASTDRLRQSARRLDERGGVFSDEQLEKVAGFTKAWKELSDRFAVVIQQIVVGLAPAIQKIIDMLSYATETIQAMNRVAERNPFLQFALRGAFPAFEAFGSGQGTAASDALNRAQGRATQESVNEQKKQTSLLEQLNSKFSGDHFAFSMTGIST